MKQSMHEFQIFYNPKDLLSNNIFYPLCFLKNTYLFIYLFYERQRERSYPMIYFPNGHNSQDWAS